MDIQFPKGNYRADSSETTTFCSAAAAADDDVSDAHDWEDGDDD